MGRIYIQVAKTASGYLHHNCLETSGAVPPPDQHFRFISAAVSGSRAWLASFYYEGISSDRITHINRFIPYHFMKYIKRWIHVYVNINSTVSEWVRVCEWFYNVILHETTSYFVRIYYLYGYTRSFYHCQWPCVHGCMHGCGFSVFLHSRIHT